MPRNPKFFTRRTLVELSSRTESGLPFAPNKLIKRLVENVLARAQTLYPITIVSYTIIPNHFHIMVVVQDPSNVPKFVEYFKRETAYYVNALLGRVKHTVWCDGYDSPIILDAETALRRLTYVQLNPLSASLIEKSSRYPLSSSYWVNPHQQSTEITVKRIPRTKVPKLPHRDMTLKEIDDFSSRLQYSGTETFTLRVEPDAWMDCFEETRRRPPAELNELLNMQISAEETRLLKEKEGQFPALQVIQTQNIRKEYQPTKFGKRMICLGKDKATRLVYLKWYYGYCKNLPNFLNKKKGDVVYRTHYPPGFFAPGGFLSANLLREATPLSSIA